MPDGLECRTPAQPIVVVIAVGRNEHILSDERQIGCAAGHIDISLRTHIVVGVAVAGKSIMLRIDRRHSKRADICARCPYIARKIVTLTSGTADCQRRRVREDGTI